MRSRGGFVLVAALTVDSVGNGLFAPLSLVYFVRLTDVPLPLVGVLLTAANLVALPLPVWAGTLADRFGPRYLVVAAEAAMALGFLAFAGVTGPVGILLASTLVAVGRAGVLVHDLHARGRLRRRPPRRRGRRHLVRDQQRGPHGGARARGSRHRDRGRGREHGGLPRGGLRRRGVPGAGRRAGRGRRAGPAPGAPPPPTPSATASCCATGPTSGSSRSTPSTR